MAKILIIDDSAELGYTMRTYLEREGFDCEVATTLQEGMKLAAIMKITDAVEQLSRSAKDMAKQSEGLQELVQEFKVA